MLAYNAALALATAALHAEHELRELIALVEKLRVAFSAWLRTAHPELGQGAPGTP